MPTTKSTDEKDDTIQRLLKENHNGLKLSAGALSLMLGTSLYMGGTTAKADADSAVNNNVTSNDPENNQTTQVSSDQMSTNKAIQSSTKAVQLNGNQAQETAPVTNDAYKVTNKPVVSVNNGAQENNSGTIRVNTSISFDTDKIKGGNYLDIKVGAPVKDTSGNTKYVNYNAFTNSSDSTATPVTVDGVNVGEITPQDDGNASFYRLTFNNNITKFVNPVINLDLYFKSLAQNGLTLVGYSHDKSITSYQPKNDILIGDQAFTSGITIPVEYISDQGQVTKAQSVTTVKAADSISTAHLWLTNADGTQQLQLNDAVTGIEATLGDKLSNNIQITVETPSDNSNVTTEWKTADEVKQEITDILKETMSKGKITDLLADNSEVGTSIDVDDDATNLPTVTVTRSDITTENNQYKAVYHIQITGNSKVNFGGRSIRLANVVINKNVLAPKSGVTSASQDKQTKHTTTNVVYGGITGIPHDGWIGTSASYNGPELADQTLQNYLTNHYAAWVAIKDLGNSSNNTSPDNNVYTAYADENGNVATDKNGQPIQQGETPVPFLVNVDTESASQANGDNNSATGTGDEKKAEQVKITVNYIDQITGKSLDSYSASGDAGADAKYSTADTIAKLKKEHYTLVKDETNGKDLKFGDKDATYTVYFGHETKDINQTKQVKETIHYVYASGNKATYDYVAKPVSFTRSGKEDLVTSKDTWDAWKPSKATFMAVASPAIPGYTADKPIVDAQDVTADSKDPEITVTYTKNSSNNNQSDNQSQDSQGNNTTTPESNNSNVSGDTIAQGVAEGQADASMPTTAAPKGYKWVLEPVEVANKKLPQTGNAEHHNIFYVIIGTLLALFGISLSGVHKKQA